MLRIAPLRTIRLGVGALLASVSAFCAPVSASAHSDPVTFGEARVRGEGCASALTVETSLAWGVTVRYSEAAAIEIPTGGGYVRRRCYITVPFSNRKDVRVRIDQGSFRGDARMPQGTTATLYVRAGLDPLDPWTFVGHNLALDEDGWEIAIPRPGISGFTGPAPASEPSPTREGTIHLQITYVLRGEGNEERAFLAPIDANLPVLTEPYVPEPTTTPIAAPTSAPTAKPAPTATTHVTATVMPKATVDVL